MAKRRNSPTGEDIQRIAETLINNDSFGNIQDFDSFEQAYEEYMLEGGQDEMAKRKDIKEKVFNDVMQIRPSVERDRIFSKAGGKDLKKDRKTNAKTIVTDRREYEERGASKVDLKGYDTKPKTRRERFRFIGKSKGKTVFAEKVFINFKGKRMRRYRDKKGRFASVKT